MSVAVSVVVPVQREQLSEVVRSLDDQSLPPSRFEVVLVGPGVDGGTWSRLRQLGARRPNVVLAEDADAAVPPSWLAACTGSFVLRLAAGDRLFPEALERLLAQAETGGLDAVLGRVVEPGAPLSELSSRDRDELDPALVPDLLTRDPVLLRRTLLEAGDGTPGAPRVGVLARYPTAARSAASGERPGSGGAWRVRQDQPEARWVADRLQVRTTGTVAAEDPAHPVPPEVDAVVLVREVGTGLSYLLEPSAVALRVPDQAAGSPAWWQVELDVDVREAALGAPLPAGRWEIDVQLTGLGAEPPAPVTVPWVACRPALLGSVPVVVAPAGSPTLQLDVGPTSWPFVADAAPEDGGVTESARGSRLVLWLPGVHVAGEAVLPGQIALDRLRLPARLVSDGSAARLEAVVTGLHGRPRLSAQFGSTPLRPTGLRLVISGTGTMTLAPDADEPPTPTPAAAAKPEPKAAPTPKPKPKAAPKPAPKAKPTPKATGKGGGTPPARRPARPPHPAVQVARRIVPAPLRPLARRAVGLPVLRRLRGSGAR